MPHVRLDDKEYELASDADGAIADEVKRWRRRSQRLAHLWVEAGPEERLHRVDLTKHGEIRLACERPADDLELVHPYETRGALAGRREKCGDCFDDG